MNFKSTFRRTIEAMDRHAQTEREAFDVINSFLIDAGFSDEMLKNNLVSKTKLTRDRLDVRMEKVAKLQGKIVSGTVFY